MYRRGRDEAGFLARENSTASSRNTDLGSARGTCPDTPSDRRIPVVEQAGFGRISVPEQTDATIEPWHASA